MSRASSYALGLHGSLFGLFQLVFVYVFFPINKSPIALVMRSSVPYLCRVTAVLYVRMRVSPSSLFRVQNESESKSRHLCGSERSLVETQHLNCWKYQRTRIQNRMASDELITRLNVSTNTDEEDGLRAQHFSPIDVDLNYGTKGRRVFLWYKKECGEKPITRIQFSFIDELKAGLLRAGFEQIQRDLNAGAGGDFIYLWYFCGDTDEDVPIVDLKVTVDAYQKPELLKNGYERLGCDLNRKVGGHYVYLWVKRKVPTYIHEITATIGFNSDQSLFEQGYTRMDEDANRGAGGEFIFLWYRRLKTKNKALSAVAVSTNSEEELNLKRKGFNQVTVDLNKGAGGSFIFVWTQHVDCQKIQGINLLVNEQARVEYKKAGVEVTEKNLNEGTKGIPMYLAHFKS